MTLSASISTAFDYLSLQSVEIPADVWYQTVETGLFRKATKAAGDIGSINAAYHDAISKALTDYLEGGTMAGPKNRMKRAMVEGFGDAFGTGYTDGGAELPFDGEALEWFNARTQQELAFIDTLFVQAKELRKDEEADLFAFANERADSYTRTLAAIYNAGRMWAKSNLSLTWHLGQTEKHCATCSKLNGQSHRASWYLARNYIPRQPGAAMLCGGYYCDCSLKDKSGKVVTI